jgi:hypothetical protein
MPVIHNAMPLDIYTTRPIVTPSNEHVIPNFLGGKLEVAGLIDRTTNSGFGQGTMQLSTKRYDRFAH